jgi:hypothetical protein
MPPESALTAGPAVVSSWVKIAGEFLRLDPADGSISARRTHPNRPGALALEGRERVVGWVVSGPRAESGPGRDRRGPEGRDRLQRNAFSTASPVRRARHLRAASTAARIPQATPTAPNTPPRMGVSSA